MNYKIMQRPMFRLGGGVIKGKQVGNRENFQSPTLEDLFKEKAELRQKAYGSMKQMLPFSVLASQMDDIRTIRKPGDILNILSNLGGSQELMGALTKLPGIDLKIKEGELSDKIDLEKIKLQKNKKTATELKLKASADARSLMKQYGSVNQMPAEIQTQYYDLRNIATGDLTPGRARSLAVRLVESDKSILAQGASAAEKEKKIQELINSFLGSGVDFAEGGRVGYQDGTPNPNMVMPQPKPQEAVQDKQLDTLMEAAPALENPREATSMNNKDMYATLRRRLPPEITDDVVRLIAYNQEAFADFANISDQSDVESFNQKYNVELVLPVGNQ